MLAGTAAAAAAMLQGKASRAATYPASRVLRFVPQSDLSNMDPVWSSNFVVRNAGLLVWDTLYGVDSEMRPQRQMVGHEEVSPDGLRWTFTLRPGLRFHDGAPVRAQDAVASLKRWAVRDTMGQRIASIQDSLAALDDRTFRWTLKRPFPKMLFALAKSNTPCTFVFPERVAQTDPFKMITEFVGSGPMRFVKDEWVIGSGAAFERFADYVPRDEPGSWMAGGKRIHFDRIEWRVLPDAATAANALMTGEVDWVESPQPDLLPLLAGNRAVRTGISNPLGTVTAIRLNHKQPPFDNPALRRALLMAIDQDDYTISIAGDDPAMRKRMMSFFTPDTPLYTEAGSDLLKRPRDLAAARKAIVDAGYKGEPLVLLSAQDIHNMRAASDVSAELFRQLGFNVELVATDFATIQVRRGNKGPVSQGGWSAFSATHSGIDCINPAAYFGLRANGDRAWFGWPDSARVEEDIRDWFDAPDLEAEKAIAQRINAHAMEDVVFVPTGLFLNKHAWRNGMDGIVSAPMPVFWDVRKPA
ncbi:ABC transporter substrate-binding protein [Roseomonas sp. OT10]|uniref:ABC transporter substrate-binding protein n=1 Tax=Roseomonas cutis TaxID=2897332 RepID=UPI001E41CD65|nr:ABC transporter substrate-binding protein [Roseomonas sp. OT10]UFN47431.1 ABC transporter substrate-binding protein [Roseomonas sp. OT10]